MPTDTLDASITTTEPTEKLTPGAITSPGASGSTGPGDIVTLPPVVPETYDLKLPNGSTVDPAIVERTAATARVLGLSNEAAQTLLDQTVEGETTRATAESEARATAIASAEQALMDSWKPGGEAWKARVAEWETAAKADPELGKTPEQFAETVEKGQQALAKYGPELKTYLNETGLGSNPFVIKFLANIGRAMSESTLVVGASGTVAKPRSTAQLMYPEHYNEDGTPKP